MTVTVSELRVGDRVSVKWPGMMYPNVGTVFFVGRGCTSAKRDDGTGFLIKHCAKITLLAPAPEGGAA